MNQLENIKNFGPYMVKIMKEIGIHTKDELMQTDYLTIKRLLQNKGIQPHLNIFYSIEMGLQDRNWNSITPEEKREIQQILQSEK